MQKNKFEAEKAMLLETIRAREEAMYSWQTAKFKVDEEMLALSVTAEAKVAAAQKAERAKEEAVAQLKAENAMLLATSSTREKNGHYWKVSNGKVDKEQKELA